MLRNSRAIGFLIVAAVSVWPTNTLRADTTATTEFCVTVGTALSVIAPVATVPLTHDGLSGIKEFAPAVMTVISNDVDGATCTFETTTAMVHQTLPLEKRDIGLSLAVLTTDPAAAWAVTAATDQTDFGNLIPDETATVVAESTGPGNATLALVISFITGDESTLIPGDYCATITATITAK
ncbi:MAG: hypothetical protein RH917_05865 [Lacipirellulaceae bacterium]